jgi:hypothetical protein
MAMSILRKSLLFAVLLPMVAMAEGGKPGEVWVTLKGADYCKPYQGGEEWSEHEFEANGFKLVIRLSNADEPQTFEVKPSDESLAPVTITTEPKKFKPARVKGEKLPRLVMKVDAKFEPKPAAPPPEPAPAPAPAP